MARHANSSKFAAGLLLSALALTVTGAGQTAPGVPPTTAAAAEESSHITVEQATSRSSPDLAPAYEGRRVQIDAQVASKPVWGVETYFVAIRDDSGFGIL